MRKSSIIGHMKAFVDSGVYLDYLRGGVNLHILELFEQLLYKKKFGLIFPNITKEEIYRGIPLDQGRYIKGKFHNFSMPNVPAGIEEGEKYKETKDLYDKFAEKLEELRHEALIAVGDILKNHIQKLYKNSESTKEDKRICDAAGLRKMKQNPPGKHQNPLGDEIVWELILQKYSDDDVVIIVHDEDWRCMKEKTKLHPFLEMEWQEKTKKKIKLFDTISQFIDTIEPKKITKKDKESEKKANFYNFVDAPSFSLSPSSSPSISSVSPFYVGSASASPSISSSRGLAISCSMCGKVNEVLPPTLGIIQLCQCGSPVTF